MSDAIDLEQCAADARNQPIPESNHYRVCLWDDDGFDEKRTLSDPMPTGRQVLELFERNPPEDYVLLMLTRDDGLVVVDLTETIDIRTRGAERFFAFKTDRIWNWSIDGQRYPWGARRIPEGLVRLIGRIPETKTLFLERTDVPDEEIAPDTSIDLGGRELEKLHSKPRSWKLNVQGVIITLTAPSVVVKDALAQAGFDPDAGWIAILKKVGRPKQQVALTDTIDLSTPGIEKLRLTPAEINNGEGPSGLCRQFRLLEKDEAYLAKRALIWESIIEGGRRWLIIRSMGLPAGFNHSSVDIAIDVPATYPSAAIDMFYCAPHLKLASGASISKTESIKTIGGVSYQRWSRHLNGKTRWNPQTDSVVTHLAVIEESLLREVGDEI